MKAKFGGTKELKLSWTLIDNLNVRKVKLGKKKIKLLKKLGWVVLDKNNL